jgi:hypothetical protein
MPLSIKDNSAWKTVNGVYVKDGGAWKTVQAGFIKDGNAWKQFYTNIVAARILVVGGGGSGAGSAQCTCGGGGSGATAGGGGGGGGFIDTTQNLTPGTSYSITVGGTRTNSVFNNLTAFYGGNGGAVSCSTAFGGEAGGGSGSGIGGSGGGGARLQGATAGDGVGTSYSDITGINTAYRLGGIGGSMNRVVSPPAPHTAYGSGGRGGVQCGPSGGYPGATSGIQGVVILRFPSYISATTTGSVSISTAGTDSVYTFTSPGTIAFN